MRGLGNNVGIATFMADVVWAISLISSISSAEFTASYGKVPSSLKAEDVSQLKLLKSYSS